MFKRVAKRQRKREEEEELGLDGDMKQVLGLQDTDSDESQDTSSDSESGNDSDLDSQFGGDESSGGVPDISPKRKHSARAVRFQSSDESDGDEGFSGLEIPETESNAGDTDDDDGPPMGVIAATTNPIFDVPGAPPSQDLRSCVVCPGRLLKSTKMTKVHVESTAHLRRLQRYTDHVSKVVSSPGGLTTDDPREILREIFGDKTPEERNPDPSSNRSQRKSLWKAKQAERKKARKKTKTKNTGKDDGDTGASALGDEDAKSAGSFPKPNKSRKKGTNTTDVPVSIAVDLPTSSRPRDVTVISKEGKGQESDTTVIARPTKRQKRDNQVEADTSSRADKAGPSLQTKSASERVDGKSRDSKRTPKLKRHNTSLYFADDEKRPASPVKHHTRTSSKHDARDTNDKLGQAIISSPVKRPPRDDGSGASGVRERRVKGEEKDKKRKNEPRDDGTGRGGGRPLYRKKDDGKGLSAKQWGGGQVLQIYD